MIETIEKNETEIETEIEEAKPYTFRALKAEDTPYMFRIIGKIGLKEFKTMLSDDGVKAIIKPFTSGKTEETEESAEEKIALAGVAVALEIADVVCCNIPKAEDEIFAFLARVSDLDEKAVRSLDFAVFAEMLIDFFRKEEFPAFFKVVSKLFK